MLPSLLTLAITSLLVLVLLVGVAAWLMALVLLRPPRMTDARALHLLQRLSPSDLGLRYENDRFVVRDEATGGRLTLRGWWIPCPAADGRCVVLVHGYSDAKIGAIAWAPLWHELGYNILAVDLRAHGESDGRYSTGGFVERHDLGQVLNELHATRPADTKRVVLFGVSLGAAVVAATAALRDDVAAVVLECPFPEFRTAAANHTNILGGPGRLLQGLAYLLANRIAGVDFADVAPVVTIGQVRCPLMIIQAGRDVFIPPADAARLRAAADARPPELGATVCWLAEHAHHVTAIYDDSIEYRQRIEQFLATVK